MSAGPAVGPALMDARIHKVVPCGALRIRLLLRSIKPGMSWNSHIEPSPPACSRVTDSISENVC